METTNARPCSVERTELIHQALEKMVGVSQLSLAFVSCLGFLQFMSVVEPGYQLSKEEVLKKGWNYCTMM